jgi:hypothetical protein
LQEISTTVESKIKEFGKSGLDLMQKQGAIWDDFPYKSRTPFKIVQKMADMAKDFDDFSKIDPFINDVSGWCSDKKNTKGRVLMEDLYHGGLNQLLSFGKGFHKHPQNAVQHIDTNS